MFFPRRTILSTITIFLASSTLVAWLPAAPTVKVHANTQASVTLVDYAFRPLRLNITTGTTVTWTYAANGSDIHTVTSKNTTQNGTPVFHSTNPNPLHPGQWYNYTFNQPGNYAYYCAVHPTLMNAWINVTGSPVNPPPSNPPPSNPPGSSPPHLLILPIAVGAVGLSAAFLAIFVYRRRPKRPSTE